MSQPVTPASQGQHGPDMEPQSKSAPSVTCGSVEGQVVIVAGASSGMGRATACLLAESGARVVAAARREEELTRLVGQLAERGLSALSCPTDVTKREQVERLVSRSVEAFGRVDALVYAAGINRPERAVDVLPPEVWENILAINLTGAYHCTQVLLPQMVRQGGGLFLYISSLAVLSPNPSGVAYKASKHGLKGLADGVVYEHYRDGIRCTVVIPGLTDTPLLAQRPAPADPARLTAALKPEDVAATCRFVIGMPKHVRIPELILEPAGLL